MELQINSIAKIFGSGIPEHFNLDESLSGLVGDLFTVYDSQITRIHSQPEADSNLAKYVLSWLYYTFRPITSIELEEILGKEVGKWKEKPTNSVDSLSIRKVCLDLVRFAPDTKVMSFFHFSFKEYLEKQHALHGALPVDELVLAEACMEYLLEKGRAPPKTRPSNDVKIKYPPPFYGYAALYWGHHLRRARNDLSTLSDRTTQLFRALVTDIDKRYAVCDIMFLDETVSALEREEYFTRNGHKPLAIHFVAYFDLVEPGMGSNGYLDTAASAVEHMGRTAFHIVAEKGFSASLGVLLNFPIGESSGLDRNTLLHGALTSTDKMQRNVWHYAALGGHEKVLGLLMSQLTSVEIVVQKIASTDIQGKTPLACAASGGHLEVLKLLLEGGIYITDAEDSLLAAVQNGHSNAVKLFLEHGISPKYQHLLAAITSGIEDSVKLLLDYGLKIDSKEAQGSALHEAALNGKKPILSSLIWNGADLEIEDSENRTPLSIAVEKGDTQSVKALLEAGSDPDVTVITNSDSDSAPSRTKAISYAAFEGMFEIFQLLRKAGADASSTFFPAIEHGQFEIVKLHLKAGVSPYLESKNGTAIAVAAESGHQDIVGLLQNWERRKSNSERFSAPKDEITHLASQTEDSRLAPQLQSIVKTAEAENPASDFATGYSPGLIGGVRSLVRLVSHLQSSKLT